MIADIVLLMALCVLQILAAAAAGACALALRDQVRAGLLVPLWAVAGVCVGRRAPNRLPRLRR